MPVLLAAIGLVLVSGTLAGCSGLGSDLPDSAATAQADTASSAGLISLAAAKDRVDRFDASSGGGGTENLSGDLERGSFGGRDFAVFNLETAGGRRSFKVDVRTGEVLEASWADRLAPPPPNAHLSPDEAESRAGRLAGQRFVGFNELSLVEQRFGSAANGNRVYTFKWAKLAPDTGAELPTSVSLSLTEASGALVWYLVQRMPVEVAVEPAVMRAESVTAATALADRDGTWETSKPSSVRLQGDLRRRQPPAAGLGSQLRATAGWAAE